MDVILRATYQLGKVHHRNAEDLIRTYMLTRLSKAPPQATLSDGKVRTRVANIAVRAHLESERMEGWANLETFATHGFLCRTSWQLRSAVIGAAVALKSIFHASSLRAGSVGETREGLFLGHFADLAEFVTGFTTSTFLIEAKTPPGMDKAMMARRIVEMGSLTRVDWPALGKDLASKCSAFEGVGNVWREGLTPEQSCLLLGLDTVAVRATGSPSSSDNKQAREFGERLITAFTRLASSP